MRVVCYPASRAVTGMGYGEGGMSEHDEQAALFGWAQWARFDAPELDLLFAVPNGGHRHKATAAKMKAEGVKKGVPDVFLPVARDPFIGLWIEMKFGYNKPTKEQAEWMEALRAQGYRCEVCYRWQDAAAVIADYLGFDLAF
jgi:hypothetical protein